MKIIIPAREGSKGLPHKNRKLFRYTTDVIPKEVDAIVTTDDNIIKETAYDRGYDVLYRSEELSNDTASVRDVLLNVIESFDIKSNEIIVMLYLTYPQRTWADVQDAIKFFEQNKAQSLLCQKKVDVPIHLYMFPKGSNEGIQVFNHDIYRRQSCPTVFEISHFVFIAYAGEVQNLNRNLYNKNTVFMPIDNVLDIDTQKDLDKL